MLIFADRKGGWRGGRVQNDKRYADIIYDSSNQALFCSKSKTKDMKTPYKEYAFRVLCEKTFTYFVLLRQGVRGVRAFVFVLQYGKNEQIYLPHISDCFI